MDSPPPLSANCGVTGRWVYRPPCPERPLIKLSQTATGCRHSFFPVKRGTHRSGTLVAASWKEEEGETSIARSDVDDAHAKSHPSIRFSERNYAFLLCEFSASFRIREGRIFFYWNLSRSSILHSFSEF